MSNDILSGSELREAVFALVCKELGADALVRYISENFSEQESDYTKERRALDQLTIEEIAAEIEALKASRGGSLAPKGATIITADAIPNSSASGRPATRPQTKPPKRRE